MKEANIRQIQLWKSDSWESVECYNTWFMDYAPQAFRSARKGVMEEVVKAFDLTDDLRNLTVEALLKAPSIISVLRMVTSPPLAQDRLIGLSRTTRHLLKTLESGRVPHEKIGRPLRGC